MWIHSISDTMPNALADFIGLSYFSIGTQVTCTYITWLPQPIETCSVTTRPSSHVLEASIKTPKEILFCKQTGLYILHTMWGLVVVTCTSKTNFMYFQTAPVVVYFWRQYWVCHSTGVVDLVGVYVNISPFEEWLKIWSKTSLVMWHRAIKSI